MRIEAVIVDRDGTPVAVNLRGIETLAHLPTRRLDRLTDWCEVHSC